MDRLLGRYVEVIYAVLRIAAGLMFAQHGAQKIFGALGGTAQPIFSMLGVAGGIELVGGLLIAAGFLGTYAAFVSSGEMAVAYFLVHFPRGFLPLLNQGELAVVYCFLFLFIAARGSGSYSADSALRRRRER